MINLIVVGIGDLANKIIPAVKKLEDMKLAKNLIFVDIKPVKEILNSITIDDEWFKRQLNHTIIHDDGNKNALLDKIRALFGNDDVKTVIYLATPPSAYRDCIVKYYKIASVFVLEKPWAKDLNELEETLKAADNKVVLGIDHYLWKNTVIQLLEDKNRNSKLQSSNFDFVLTEELPNPKRKYYWDYGEVADMMPHVLPLLDKLFNMETTILDSDNLKFICAICSPSDPEYSDHENGSIIKNETFIELESSLENKVIHIVLGKGIKFTYTGKETTKSTRFLSDDSKLLINFEEEENTAYTNILLYIAKEIKNISKGRSSKLLSAESMKRYVNKIDKFQKRINKSYGATENENGRSIALRKFPELIYCQDKQFSLQYHKDNECMINRKGNC